MDAYLDRNESYIRDDERRIIVSILVTHLVEDVREGFAKNYYPTSERKEGMAKAIIKAFPCLAMPGRDGIPSYAHFFSRKVSNGLIDQKLKADQKCFFGSLKRKRSPSVLKGKKLVKRNDGHCRRLLVENAVCNEEVRKYKVIFN